MKRLDASSLHPFVLGFALLGCTPTTTERSATSGDGAPASAAAPSVASPSAGRASGQSVPSAPATNTPHSSVAVPPATLPTAERSASSGSDSAGSAVRACGALGCQRFESAAAAFDAVLATSPRVLGIGEAHAQKGSASVASSTARFMNELLPRLAGKASDLVIELWVAAGNCGTVEKEVAERQKPVVEAQAATNQSEFVELGHRAKALGIEPHALVPTCEEYQTIANAGPNDIDRMLEMIARATARQIEALLERRGRAKTGAAPPLIVAYGGALHNDIAPRLGREHWSFGPRLDTVTRGAYVELDLIVPEFVKDTETWRALPWFSAYRALSPTSDVVLYSPTKNSFTLIFARTPQSDTER